MVASAQIQKPAEKKQVFHECHWVMLNNMPPPFQRACRQNRGQTAFCHCTGL